jgi:hypothetical protein
METVTQIIGSEDDGWNVMLHVRGEGRVEFACEDREHAEELSESLERCTWYAMRPGK